MSGFEPGEKQLRNALTFSVTCPTKWVHSLKRFADYIARVKPELAQQFAVVLDQAVMDMRETSHSKFTIGKSFGTRLVKASELPMDEKGVINLGTVLTVNGIERNIRALPYIHLRVYL